MPYVQAYESGDTFNFLSERPTVTTDAQGNFSYIPTQTYSAIVVQAQPISPISGVLSVANALSVTINTVTPTLISGTVFGTTQVSVPGLTSALPVTAKLTSPVQVMLMVDGR